MENIDGAILKLFSKRNLKGVPTHMLIYELQDCRDEIADAISDDSQQFYCKCRIEAIVSEIGKRRKLQSTGVVNTNRETLEAIKAALKIEDVLEWYTDIIVPRSEYRGNWTYRCTLHGPDNHPSGTIYRSELRAWCHACNKGGDIFDIVQLFEGIDLPRAIKKLATHIGLELRPLRSLKRKMGVVID